MHITILFNQKACGIQYIHVLLFFYLNGTKIKNS